MAPARSQQLCRRGSGSIAPPAHRRPLGAPMTGRSHFVAISALALALALAGTIVGRAVQPTIAQTPAPGPSSNRAAATFQAQCAGCHGDALAGGRAASLLDDHLELRRRRRQPGAHDSRRPRRCRHARLRHQPARSADPGAGGDDPRRRVTGQGPSGHPRHAGGGRNDRQPTRAASGSRRSPTGWRRRGAWPCCPMAGCWCTERPGRLRIHRTEYPSRGAGVGRPGGVDAPGRRAVRRRGPPALRREPLGLPVVRRASRDRPLDDRHHPRPPRRRRADRRGDNRQSGPTSSTAPATSTTDRGSSSIARVASSSASATAVRPSGRRIWPRRSGKSTA